MEHDPASRAPWLVPKLPEDGLIDRARVGTASKPRVALPETEKPDPLRDALSHIAKTAAASRTQSRRCRWIQQRAEGALAGVPYKAGDFEMPKMSSNSPERLAHKNRHLRVELGGLKDAARALLDQIERGTFIDAEAHPATMLKSVQDLTAILVTAGAGLEADPPEIELLEWIDASKLPNAGTSYLLEIREDGADTTITDLGWWDDKLERWISNESGGAIAGKVLRYSDPRGLGAR